MNVTARPARKKATATAQGKKPAIVTPATTPAAPVVTPPVPTTKAAAGTDWGQIAQQALPGLIQARYLDKVLAENLRREKAGLPPLDVEKYQPGVKVGMDPQTRGMIGWGVAGLLGLLGLGMFWRRGSR